MKNFLKYFTGSLIFTLIALILAFYVGYSFGGDLVSAGLSAAFTALMLGILETSLSFDNAIVNAKVLDTMSAFWKRMFLTIGILIAVFGMRIVFPLLIVWIVSDKPVIDVIQMTWKNPQEFQRIIEHQHILIAGFGGAFLWMVFTKFFFDEKKEVHWLNRLESIMSKIGRMEAAWISVTLIITFVFYNLMKPEHREDFLLAAVMGILVFILVEGFSSLLRNRQESETTSGNGKATRMISAGLASFLYLEVLDASFSFDGVIGAFAITDNLFIIALGLGIGAFFVRSLTVKLVADRTLASYRYLEHGAFWAIGALSMIMYISALGIRIPEVASGSIGFIFIALSFWGSILHRNKTGKTQGDA